MGLLDPSKLLHKHQKNMSQRLAEADYGSDDDGPFGWQAFADADGWWLVADC